MDKNVKDVEFSDNAYRLMEEVGVEAGAVERIMNGQERLVSETVVSKDEEIQAAEAVVDGHLVRVVYSTKPEEFGAGYGGDVLVISANVLGTAQTPAGGAAAATS